MEEINEIKVNEATGEVIEDSAKVSRKYTLDYALEQLEKVREEATHFAEETRGKIETIKSAGPEDIGAQAAGEAMATLVKEQGELYRKLVDFYTGLIADLKKAETKATPEDRQQFLDFVTVCTGASQPGGCLPDFEKIWEAMNS